MNEKHDLTRERDAVTLRGPTRLAKGRTDSVSPQLPFEVRPKSKNAAIEPIRYFASSSEGVRIDIPGELFKMLWDFLRGDRQAGSATIHFRNGGIAGLEALIKKTFK